MSSLALQPTMEEWQGRLLENINKQERLSYFHFPLLIFDSRRYSCPVVREQHLAAAMLQRTQTMAKERLKQPGSFRGLLHSWRML